MDITIRSKIHPDRILKLIAINHGEYYEIKYAGEDRPMVAVIPDIVDMPLRDALENKVREVCKRSGDVFEVIPTMPRAREIVLHMEGSICRKITIYRGSKIKMYNSADMGNKYKLFHVVMDYLTLMGIDVRLTPAEPTRVD